MTSINSTTNNAYYQLLNQNSTAQTGTVSTLADALSASSDTSSSTDSSAYLMDLSPEAQAYLNGSSSTSSSSSNTSLASLLSGNSDTSDSSDSSDTSTTFTISSSQQKQIDDILAKYKDAPYNEDTLNKIQADLKSAGLDSASLSAKDQISSFNPTSILIGFLDGSDTSATPVQSSADEQTKSSNYNSSILSQLQSISTTYDASTSGTAAAS